MSGDTISTSDTRIEAMSLQSSAYGVTIPLLYGVNRVAGNMIWYGSFKATANTTTQGGKGGTKTQNTTFTYSASVMMGLCEGQITGISRGWKGKQLYSGGIIPTQLITTTQAYTIPAIGGSVTVTNSATYSANIGVVGTSGSGDSYEQRTLSEGTDYSRVGGAYTFVAPAGGLPLAVTITYQYITGGGSQTALQAMGLSFASGALGQATWSYLTTNFPSQAIGYSGLAYVYAQDYALGTGAQVENHTFEVQGPQAYSISTTIPDANPCASTMDALINGRYGAAFPSSQLGTVTAWSTYCLASGILMSPLVDTQMQAGEFAAMMAKLTNTALVWSGGKLKMIPYGDSALTANGVTYTPNVTPVYDLVDDDYLTAIKVVRKPQADAYNHIRVEFLNRSNLYNIEIAEAKDSANIDVYGLRSADILKAHWICDATIARTVAQLLLQRSLYIRNTYEFQLGWTKALLEPMDLVTLTDTPLAFNKLPVRITEINESESGDLDVVAEDFPLGIATSSLYGSQAGAGFQHDYNAAPGSIQTPVIFEAPGALTQNGLELYVAATGLGSAWGGCHVYVSLDGTTYKQVGTIYGGSRYGTLSAACGASGTVAVALLAGALTSGSVADATALNTLCYIDGAADEYIAFNTATLTSALHYNLAGTMVRGAYGTTAAAHSSGDKFVRVDTSVAKSGPIDLGYVGKTVHIKCTSFNLYGAAEESIASVTDYTYAITGALVYGNAGASALLGVTNASSDNLWTAGEKPPVILDVTNINAEQAGLDAQATAYFITTEKTTYDTAVSALNTHLATLTTPVAWNNLTGDTTIVGTIVRSKFADVYAAAQALRNKIADTARQLGGGNRLNNSSFEANSAGAGMPDSWSLYQTGSTGSTVGVRTALASSPHGAYVCSVTANALGSTAGDAIGVAQTIPLNIAIAQKAFLSVTVAPTAATSSLSMLVNFFNSSAVQIGGNGVTVALPTGFHRYQLPCDVPAGTASASVYIYANAASVAGSTVQIFVDAAQFEIGALATAYAPRADEILQGAVGAVEIAPGGATLVSSANVTGPVTIAAQSFTPDSFSVNTQMASITLSSGPAPELGTASIDVLVSVSAQWSVSGVSGQTLAMSLQNNATYDGFRRKDIANLPSTTSASTGQVFQSARFTVTANASVTFGVWANRLLGSGTNTLSNIEMRIEGIKR